MVQMMQGLVQWLLGGLAVFAAIVLALIYLDWNGYPSQERAEYLREEHRKKKVKALEDALKNSGGKNGSGRT